MIRVRVRVRVRVRGRARVVTMIRPYNYDQAWHRLGLGIGLGVWLRCSGRLVYAYGLCIWSMPTVPLLRRPVSGQMVTL